MTYPNAYAGVRKLITAEVLQIIAMVLSAVIAALSLITVTGAEAALPGSDAAAVSVVGAGIALVISGLAVVVLTIISIILNMAGLRQASEDEPNNFRIAFILSIVLLIASILSGASTIFSFLAKFSSLFKTAINLGTIGMFFFTVTGISTLAKAFGRTGIEKLGMTVLIIEFIQLALSTAGIFTGGLLRVISSVVGLVGYIFYLVYLAKAKKMLQA